MPETGSPQEQRRWDDHELTAFCAAAAMRASFIDQARQQEEASAQERSEATRQANAVVFVLEHANLCETADDARELYGLLSASGFRGARPLKIREDEEGPTILPPPHVFARTVAPRDIKDQLRQRVLMDTIINETGFSKTDEALVLKAFSSAYPLTPFLAPHLVNNLVAGTGNHYARLVRKAQLQWLRSKDRTPLAQYGQPQRDQAGERYSRTKAFQRRHWPKWLERKLVQL